MFELTFPGDSNNTIISRREELTRDREWERTSADLIRNHIARIACLTSSEWGNEG